MNISGKPQELAEAIALLGIGGMPSVPQSDFSVTPPMVNVGMSQPSFVPVDQQPLFNTMTEMTPGYDVGLNQQPMVDTGIPQVPGYDDGTSDQDILALIASLQGGQ